MTGLLSLVLWLPLAGAVTLLAIPQDRHATLRIVTLVVALLDLAAALCAGAAMDLTHTGTLQLVERASWIPSIGVSYHLGTDGLSLSLVVLTALLLVLCVVYSWRIETRVKEYMILLLLLETGLVGVFVALDLFLFYVFWEVSLVPMYFLIGIWGGPRRGYAAIKFFIYTVAGSLAMLLAILLVYVHSNPRTFDLVDLIGRRRRLGQDASQVLVVCRGLRGQRVQVARPALDCITRVDLAVQDRSGVLDDVVDVGDVGLEVTDDRLGRVDQPLQGGTQPADGLCRFVDQLADPVLGQRGKPSVSGVQRRPDLTGHRALGDGLSL